MKNHYLYIHYKSGTKEPFYVGQGSSSSKKGGKWVKYGRAYCKSKRGRSAEWHEVVEKFGFDVEILAENLSQFEVNLAEKTEIARYGLLSEGGLLVNKLKETNSHGMLNARPAAKLLEHQVREIKTALNSGIRVTALTRKYNVSDSTIRGILYELTWVWVEPKIKHYVGKIGNKLREDDIKIIQQLDLEGYSYQQIADLFDVSTMSVLRILNGHHWGGTGKSLKHKTPTKKQNKLDEGKVIEIKNKMVAGVSNSVLSLEYDVDMSTLQRIKKGETWNGVGPDVTKLPKRALTEDIVKEIKIKLKNGLGSTYAAREFGVARSTIERIRDGKLWTHITV